MTTLREFKGIEGSNFFDDDHGFQSILGEILPADDLPVVLASLSESGALVGGRWNELANEGARPEQAPRIIKTDRAGNPVERVDFGPSTRQLRREVAEFGVLTRPRNEVHKFALVYLLAHNGEASLTCPISCTDGAIRAVEQKGSDFLRETYLAKLRSSDIPFGGAQFITEPGAGSDVGAIETIARQGENGNWTISGEKWFCSNPDEFFVVAARPEGAPGGTEGVAVFLVPRRGLDGKPNGLAFRRLKDKLGTRSLPTAEIDFNDAVAYPLGEPGEGFKTLMNYVINVSRVHNAANACGFLHRAFLEARNYARQRTAFGNEIISYPLVRETLLMLLERLWRNRLLTFRLVALIDRNGLTPSDPREAMWQRFLVNLAKYRTASTLTDSIREAILLFGGNGIVEDFTVLPRLLRDAMIIETWEGAHNTLCLQILRDAARSDLLVRWRSEVGSVLERWPRDFLSATRSRFDQTFRQTVELLFDEDREDPGWGESHARRIIDRLGSLLEIGWMAALALARVSEDATAALLTSAASYRLLPTVNVFEHPALEVLAEYSGNLIDEIPIRANVGRL
ncbi:MAG TPA: acyl-CoA dehydrogenase family protein [Blastocatellia bacterium]|nr:acyl-CoA dehydrogenase family protein [Blastocatellia bacterium]